ncbi:MULTISPECIES: RecE family exodeoxyribonuclease [Citrobacter]|uniref:RecE family exodeoxyribonuclease n=1 Tax=Citrobacter TaxID=544 RepID=UPI00197CD6B2|nr:MULTISPECIES: RecE family exodeoxyribonuclease [Citrobacter]MBN4807704.1 PD-(D/E)XK nuclease-like domain-containing protein [Citrobacter braakii]MBN4813256.1 PD-(D/E)XK nuclease-like domain-containing protein [Citrobacter braakii]MBN4822755.1 PD-(D/E)XK nuclease-like domain-containing protein [Citrobacter braakii]MBN4836753.1 PD-(D/E)XK nuclease-like domain-containing protein [Citrobacter braakii]MBN4850395.1 PD-(D/E)XK nuclease-like domain-containing protein [Citrobacter braakii]
MEFPYVVKATQKSGKPDAFVWFTAKTEARANLMLDVALEDAGIETGRGKDYAKPIRTDFPVVDGLPKEGEVDLTWCDRYELQDDGRTWLPKAAGVSTGSVDAPSTPTPTVIVEDATASEIVPVENRTPAVRFAVHLMIDKYQTHINKELQLAASEMSLDEGNTYLQSMLVAKNDVPETAKLSLNAEWKMIQAVKDIFTPDEEHEPRLIAAFMSDWVNTDAGDRNQLIEDWRSGKLQLLKTETSSGANVTTGQDLTVEDGIQADENGRAEGGVVDSEVDTEEQSQQIQQPNLIVVATLPFRQRVLAQFIGDGEYLYHVDAGQKNEIVRLEMDTDDAYVQNLLLAAENVEAFKKAIEHDIHKVVNAVKKAFPIDGKKPELATVIQFLTVWFNTDYIDRGLLVKEWSKGNRISSVQRTDSGTNADGGSVTDRGPDAHHTLDTLDLEIACALLPMDFNHFEIPGSILRRAKEIVTKKEEPWKSWSSILRNQPGVLGVNRTAIFNLVRIAPENIHLTHVAHLEFVNQTMTAAFNAAVELLPLHEAEPATQRIPQPESKEPPRKSFCTHEENLQRVREEGARRRAEEATAQPQKVEQELVKNVGNGIFDVTALLQNSATHGTKKATETTSNVQVQETVSDEKQAGTEVQSGKSSMETGEESDTRQQADVNQNTDSVAQNSDSVNQTEPVLAQTEPDAQSDEPAVVYPAYFEPGRYEGLPNEVYHAANGISSTQVKDARVSLMYFNARHVEKTIIKERSPVLDMGNLVHALALQPEQLDEEFSVEPVIPEGAFTTTATIRAFIDEYNANLPAQLSADDIKALLEEHNATLPAQLPLGGSLEETGQSYMSLPEEYQRIEADQKQTAAAMKACIKEYNATLPAQAKTSGSRDVLLEQLAIINPDLVAQEVQKPAPLKVSGTKADLIQAVKSVNPDAVFADELLDAWRENPQGKVLVTRQQLSTALSIQKALLEHPTAGKLLTHPGRAVEVSYFGFDDETGLEVRVRPDLEIDLDGVRIGADLKTISMWNIKQEGLRAKLHREIIDRDYHLSAAMYCETAALDQFFWIFVNKDENYHWIAIIEASAELLELGMLEYRKSMRAIATGFDTGEWPAPITADYTDELNDFDLRRLEALRTQA